MDDSEGCFGWAVVLGLIAWGVLGEPKYDVASWFYSDSPAPWEEITAIYYPDRNDLSFSVTQSGLDNLIECREWVNQMAFIRNDRNLMTGDYECGVNFREKFYDIDVYRLTLR